MTQTPASVIVVSRGRPQALLRCLTGLSQQVYTPFEVVVVADPGGIRAVGESGFRDRVKLVGFDQANISAARNLGLAEAAGDIVAFVDDDAVPEPTWLQFLTAPFSDQAVAAAGGFVRGRNGISFQWMAQSVGVTGEATPLKVDRERPSVLQPAAGTAIKTEGTNMAFRWDVLAGIGGFDPAFRYFLDETDVNLRLAATGQATAIVPLAEVHHGYLSNATRLANRAPTDLFEIGASVVVFLRKHCPKERHAEVCEAFTGMQRRRAQEHMRAGRIGADDVSRLMEQLTQGYEAGQTRAIDALPGLARGNTDFRAFPTPTDRRSVVLAGRSWNARKLRSKAVSLVAQGHIVSLFLFSPTTLFHKLRFTETGYWEQTGGLFGKSERQQRLFRFWGFSRRLEAETKRIARQRHLSELF